MHLKRAQRDMWEDLGGEKRRQTCYNLKNLKNGEKTWMIAQLFSTQKLISKNQ